MDCHFLAGAVVFSHIRRRLRLADAHFPHRANQRQPPAFRTAGNPLTVALYAAGWRISSGALFLADSLSHSRALLATEAFSSGSGAVMHDAPDGGAAGFVARLARTVAGRRFGRRLSGAAAI